MAKKSKRPRTKQRPLQRPAARPGVQPQRPAADLPADADQDDYAAGALPYTESDGPMPLPPAENGEAITPVADVGDDDSDAAGEVTAAAPTPGPVAAAAVVTGAGERRRVGRIDPAAAAAARAGQRPKGGRSTSTAAMFEPLPPEEAAIPFDRVPYVPGDLRRVLIIAAIMVVLVIAANFVVNAVVK